MPILNTGLPKIYVPGVTRYEPEAITHLHKLLEVQLGGTLTTFGMKVVKLSIDDSDPDDSLKVTDAGSGVIAIAPGAGIIIDEAFGPAYFELPAAVNLELTGSSPKYIYAAYVEAPADTTEDSHETGLARFMQSDVAEFPGALPLASVAFTGPAITGITDLREFVDFGGSTPVDASASTKGISKLSTAPASPTEPIAVGTNDARLNDATTASKGITMFAADGAATAGRAVQATDSRLAAVADKAEQSDLDAEVTRATDAESAVASDLAEHTGAVAPHSAHMDVDGSKAFSGDVNMGGHRLTNLAASSADTDALTRAEGYALASGLKDRVNVKVASTSNIGTLSGFLTVDGVGLTTDDRVLVKDQTTALQNGIYVVSSGTWSRASDADTDAELVAGTRVYVAYGTQWGKSSWTLITPSVVVGTTAQSWTQTGGHGGETNTASSSGTEGVGIVDTKAGVDLRFFSLANPDGLIAIAQNLATKSVRFSLNLSSILLQNLGGLLTVAKGGTGVTTVADLKALLGITTINATQLQGRNIDGTAPTTGQSLTWNGTNWIPGPGGGTPNALPLAGGSMTGNIAMTAGSRITGLQAAVATGEPATLGQLQALSAAYRPTVQARAGTVTALPAFTTAGNVLTMSANGALVIDGVTVAVNDRVLVKNQGTAPLYLNPYNGIYTVTATGGSSTPAVLTRSTDADTGTELAFGLALSIKEGSAANTNFIWQQIRKGTITLNTTTLQFGATLKAIEGPQGDPGVDGTGVFSAVASQSEAEAGAENTKGMTALRVAQAIVAQAIVPSDTLASTDATLQVSSETSGDAGAVSGYSDTDVNGFVNEIINDDTSTGAQFWGFRAGGTRAAKTAVVTGQRIYSLVGAAFNGSAYKVGAAIRMVASENHSTGADGTRIAFYTTQNGTTSDGATTPKMILHDDGAVQLYDTSEPGTTTNRLYPVSGALKWAGKFVARWNGTLPSTAGFVKVDTSGLLDTASMSTNKLLGRATAGSGAVEEITLGTGLSFSGTTLNAAGGGGSSGLPITHMEVESYKLDEGSGTTLHNAINGKTATINDNGGSHSWTTSGGLTALNLSGGAYVPIPRAVNGIIAQRQFSIAVLFSTPNVAPGHAQCLFSTSNARIYAAVPEDGTLAFLCDPNGAGTALSTPTGLISADTTYQVLFTWDGETQRIYLNGLDVASGTAPMPQLTADVNINIGNYRDGLLSSIYWTGKLGAFRVWERALESSEAVVLAASPLAGL